MTWIGFKFNKWCCSLLYKNSYLNEQVGYRTIFSTHSSLFAPFYFLLRIRRESIVLGSTFRTRDFNVFIRFEVPWIRKSLFFFKFSLSVCVSVISIAQSIWQLNLQIWYSAFLWQIWCYLKFFIKIAQKLGGQGHTKEFQHIMAYGRNFVLVRFRIFILR